MDYPLPGMAGPPLAIMPHYVRLVLQGSDRRQARFQPLARAAGIGGHSSLDRLGLRLEHLQPRTHQDLGRCR